jgi:hypothetical protein
MQNYTDGDILLTLKMLQTQQMGRKSLSEFLGLGEATVRTVFRKLEAETLITSTRQGQTLTKKGEQYLAAFPDFTLPQPVNVGDITLSTCNLASLIHKFSHTIRNGIQFRDAAIIAGATGATTLIFENGGFVFPYDTATLNPEIQHHLIEKFSPCENDVLIIATAETEEKAMRGLSGCLSLLSRQPSTM